MENCGDERKYARVRRDSVDQLGGFTDASFNSSCAHLGVSPAAGQGPLVSSRLALFHPNRPFGFHNARGVLSVCLHVERVDSVP